jgi:hypothetical protein
MSNTPNTQQAGAGVLAHDSKWGNILNSLASAVIYAVVAWAQDFDWSTFPVWAGQIGIPAVSVLVGLVVSKVLPRFKR